MTKLNLEVGKSYWNNKNQRILITDGIGFPANPAFWGDTGQTYYSDGRDGEGNRGENLILEIEEGDTREFRIRPGFVYTTRDGRQTTIVRELDDSKTKYKYVDTHGFFYLEDGRLHEEEALANGNDLVDIGVIQVVVNENSYAKIGTYTPQRTFSLRVEAIADMCPGAWDNPRDLMDHIAQHPYVRRVVLDEHDQSQCTVTWEDIHPPREDEE